MKFEEVLPALREGKKITSEFLKKCGYQYIYYQGKTVFDNKGGYWHLTNCELVDSDDWEIVSEKKKVKLRNLTERQYAKWKNKNCDKYVDCKECPFCKISCTFGNTAWFKNKDMYSDKCLDQEIEIEAEDEEHTLGEE